MECFKCLQEVCECSKRNKTIFKDRHPDSITNDYLYVRGEFDYLHKMDDKMIAIYHKKYTNHIDKVRKELGLKDAA